MNTRGNFQQRLKMRHEEALRQNITEGCREMWEVYVDTEQEFHPLEEEVARINDRERSLPLVK